MVLYPVQRRVRYSFIFLVGGSCTQGYEQSSRVCRLMYSTISGRIKILLA
jgi:hypothetical protein